MPHSLNRLAAVALLTLRGYKEYEVKSVVLASELTGSFVTPSSDYNALSIINVYTNDGKMLHVWNSAFQNVFQPDMEDEEIYYFKPDTYVNASNFLVNLNDVYLNLPIEYTNDNFFVRNSVHLLDEFPSLGRKIIIVGNDGVLYSMYETPSHKLLIQSDDKFYIKQQSSDVIYVNSKELVGSYHNHIVVDCIHVYPKGTFN